MQLLEKRFPNSTPTVEDAQDAVEKVLIASGHARTAKAYILYRQIRAELRAEKANLLEKDGIDEVDKAFDINALKVLKSRYLRKDENGKLIESPKELFTRVAVHCFMPDILYDSRVFSTEGSEGPHAEESFSGPEYEGKLSIGTYVLNKHHLDALKRMYDRFNDEGKMKIKWSGLVRMIENGEFDEQQKTIDEFYELMVSRRFMPNTPAIANFGTTLGMGSACFVLGVGDSMESIMETLKSTALIHKAGGGTGFNFSTLRPEGDYVSSTSGVASGPLSFMKLFDTMTEVVKQGGIRRGANMGILNINHPDIEKFIKAKEGNKALRNFNISVLIMPDFWEYYQNGTPYPLRNPRSGKITGYADPKLLFDLIVYQAWESAEPGVIFYDYVNKYNPFLKYIGPIVTTNPCVTGDTLVSIKTGTISIKELAEMYPNGGIPITVERTIQSGNQLLRALEYTSEFKAFKTGKKQITKLTTENGRELRCTADHRILTSEGWKEASSLTRRDKIFVEGGTDRLQKREPDGIEDVYDITEPATHSFIANGIVVHNCGEVLLYPNESCNLGSMNVWSYVMEGANGAYVDWEALKQGVLTASHLLDNVIDVNNYPLKAIEEMTLATRKIGLGVMGLADLLFELRLPYNSAEGRAMMEQVMEFINYHSKAESIRLAKERGPVPFFGKSFYPEGRLPISCPADRESWHFDWSALAEQIKQHGIRNGYTTVVAPTGSISMIAGCSSGMEPVYALVWEKHVAVGSFYYTEPVFEKIMKKEGLFDDDLVKDVCEAGGTAQSVGYVPPQIKNFLKVARDITPEDHIRALAAIQKWTDSSVSKTNNFPADATVDDMRQSYLLSYQLGCKDVTVFRDTSIKNQVLRVGAKTRLQQTVQPVQQVIAKDATGRSVLMSAPDVRSDNEISSNYCPKCSMKLVKQEGCMMCMDCGWGKCA